MDDLEWVRASDIPDEECIEVAAGEGDLIHLRSSNDPDAVVTTTATKWKAFVLGVRNDEFDHFAEEPETPEAPRAPESGTRQAPKSGTSGSEQLS